jgi:hypothetical protein
MAVRFQDGIIVDGRLIAELFDTPNNSISNAAVRDDAGIAATKLEHKHRKTVWQATAADATIPLHVVNGATARNLLVKAGSIVKAVGDAIVTIDIKKNGTTVLSGVTTLNSSNTNRLAVDLSVTTFTAVEDDLFEAVIDATIGTGTLPTGLFIEFEIDEVS